MIKREPTCDDRCDDGQLLRMLRRDCDHLDGDEMLDHVEQCERCQHRLDELAADETEWLKAVEILSRHAGEAANSPQGFQESPDTFGRQSSWTDSMARQLLTPPSHPDMLGRIGRYDVERLIGSGGMGVVFKAHDTELNRPVAVKLLAPYLAGSGAARNRFAREARAAAAVVDEHVVPIHNVESDGEHPFLVMKYIAGGSLQARLDREGPLQVREVLRIGMHTAKGLAAAHAQGLIHRDIKPSNILLDEGVERALLTDFGLARATDDASLTRSGFHPGTPHYMSPEQVRGETIDARSDLFGLGCVLYAMCTGHPPFRSETSYAVLRRITDDNPRPIREINANIPEWLEQIVMKLLSKSPDDRFESAQHVAQLLEACLAHVQQPATAPLPESIATASPGRIVRPPIGKFIAAAFAFPLFFAGLLIVLELNKGTLKIESDADGIPIRIMRGDETVQQLTIDRQGTTTRLRAGRYTIEFDGPMTGYNISGAIVVLKRGEIELAKVTRVDEEPPADTGTELWFGNDAETSHWYHHWSWGFGAPSEPSPDPDYIDPFRIGVSLGPADNRQIPAYYRGGLKIVKVAPNSPAANYGVEVGDVLLSWNGDQIDSDDPGQVFRHSGARDRLQRKQQEFEELSGMETGSMFFDLLDHRTGQVILARLSFGATNRSTDKKANDVRNAIERRGIRGGALDGNKPSESVDPNSSLSRADTMDPGGVDFRLSDSVDVQVLFQHPPGAKAVIANTDNEAVVFPSRVNLAPGKTFAFTLSNISEDQGLHVSGSIELTPLSRQSRAYLRHNAIPVQITGDDIDRLAGGNSVEKAIYLPSAEHASSALGGVATLASGSRGPSHSASPDKSADNPLDVNDDGRVSAHDALLIINELGREPRSDDDPAADHADSALDVDADGNVTAKDALLIIKDIDRKSSPLITDLAKEAKRRGELLAVVRLQIRETEKGAKDSN